MATFLTMARTTSRSANTGILVESSSEIGSDTMTWEGVEDRFEVGDFVFAKLKGHPHWPATISQIETHYANGAPGQERTRYNVYFYGSHQMSLIKVDSIVRFDEHYEVFKRKYATNTKFISALQELETDKSTREDYVKSLQIVENMSHDEPPSKPDDEVYHSSVESSDNDDTTMSTDRRSCASASSSGIGDSFYSDEEYLTLQNQKYEILSMEKIPYLGSSDSLLVVSLGFHEKDLLKDYEDIQEEIRMMSCFVKLERIVYSPHKRRIKRKRGPYKLKRRAMLEVGMIGHCMAEQKVVGHGMAEQGMVGHGMAEQGMAEQGMVGHEIIGYRRFGHGMLERRMVDHGMVEHDIVRKVGRPKGYTGKRKRKRNKWKMDGTGTGKWKNKPSLTVLAAEAVKRRRRPRKKNFRDETRLLSLRQRNQSADPSESIPTITNTCLCLPEECDCVVSQEPKVITCPICQADFTSSIDFKQHSFNIHIMGL